MPREAHSRLQQTLWDLQKRYGDRAIDTLARTARVSVLSSGFIALDGALSRSGVPGGRITALAATRFSTTGLTSLAYHLVTQAQHVAPVVYLDLSGTLDADYAAQCGVALDRLLVVRGVDLVQAFGLTRDVLLVGSPSLIVFDAAVMDHAATLTQLATLLRRVSEPLLKSRCVLLFLLPPISPLSQAVKEAADTVLVIERSEWLYQGRDVVGYCVEVSILKDKERAGERPVSLQIRFQRAIDGDH